jgi:hypothetical protein
MRETVGTTISSSRVATSGKKPRVDDNRRVCSDTECETVLSRYNTHKYCHLHRPVRFPRVRGVLDTEVTA